MRGCENQNRPLLARGAGFHLGGLTVAARGAVALANSAREWPIGSLENGANYLKRQGGFFSLVWKKAMRNRRANVDSCTAANSIIIQ